MFKPFAISRSSFATVSIAVVPLPDVRFVGRRKEIAVRVRFVSYHFDETEIFWVSSRMTRENFVRDFIEERAKFILDNADDRLASDSAASQES